MMISISLSTPNSFKTTASVSQNSSVNTVYNKVPAQTDNSASFHLGPQLVSISIIFNVIMLNIYLVVQHLVLLSLIRHSRLGHPHHEVLQSIIKLCNIQLPNKSLSDFCTACCFVVLVRFIGCHLLHLK